MIRAWYIVLLAVLAVPPAARAEGDAAPGRAGIAGALEAAATALRRGEHERAAELAGPLTGAEGDRADRADRAEAHRIYGLALFFLGRRAEAETQLFEYMKLDVDAHLDPALVPPEALVFFEDVRSRHAAELRAYRPKPDRTRYVVLNLIPPAGQFQNGHRTKGVIIGAGELVALGTNVATYFILRDWCPEDTCSAERADSARALRTLNLASGVAFVGLYAYGVVDGGWHYYRQDDQAASEATMSVGMVPTRGGSYLSVTGRF